MKAGRGLLLSAGLGLLTGYLHQTEALSQHAGPWLAVEIAGCDAVRADRTCQVRADKTLRVWFSTRAGASTRALLDGEEIPFEAAPAGDGARATVNVSPTNRWLTIESSWGRERAAHHTRIAPASSRALTQIINGLITADRRDVATALLDAATRDPDPETRAEGLRKLARIEKDSKSIAAAERHFADAIRLDRDLGHTSDEFVDRFALADMLLFSAGRWEDARAALEPLDALLETYPEGRVYTSYFRSLIPYEQEDWYSALRLLTAAKDGAERLGMDRYRATIVQPLGDVLATLGRYADANACFAEAARVLSASDDPCRRAELLNNQAWAGILQALSRARSEALDPGVIAKLNDALALYREHCPEKIEDIANVLTNLAIAGAEAGQLEEAQRHLAAARREVPEPAPRIRAWQLLTEGNIAHKAGRNDDALAIFDEVERFGEEWLLDEARFEASLLRAEVLEGMGRIDAAWAAHSRAEGLLNRRTLRVPLIKGRMSLFDRLEKGTIAFASFLVRRSQRAATPGEAEVWLREGVRAARRSRARLLSALSVASRLESIPPADRDHWYKFARRFLSARDELSREAARSSAKLAADERLEAERRRRQAEEQLDEELEQTLARLNLAEHREEPVSPSENTDPIEMEDGVAQLVFTRVDNGWFGFASSRTSVAGHFVTESDLADVSEGRLPAGLLDRFRGVLDGAERVRVTADMIAEESAGSPHCAAVVAPAKGPAPEQPQRIGDALLNRIPVVYGLDLPRSPQKRATIPAAARSGPRTVLMVTDPLGEFAHAQKAAGEAALLWERRGFRVERLDEGAATRAAVLAALRRSDIEVFHFAGHGAFDERSPWNSKIVVAAPEGALMAEVISAGDVLALGRAPRLVVLLACDTLKTRASSSSAGLGIAQAFILGGAEAVIASDIKLSDERASRLLVHFYELLDARGASLESEADMSLALRDAHLNEWKSGGSRAQASFRLLVP